MSSSNISSADDQANSNGYETIANKLDAIPDRFIGDKGSLTADEDRVQQCLEETVNFLHDNLSEQHRTLLTEQWGIADSMIDAKKIGYMEGNGDLVNHLRDNGFEPLTIMSTSVATDPTIKHLFECDGICPDNADIIPEEKHSEIVDNTCSHSVDETIETLVYTRVKGLINPEQINLQAVIDYVREHIGLNLYTPWDKRIVFPYRDGDNTFRYLIGRATDNTNDIVYSNGITDCTDDQPTTVAETELGRQLTHDDNIEKQSLNDLIIVPHRSRPFETPYEEGFKEQAKQIKTVIKTHVNGSGISDSGLLLNGIIDQKSLDIDFDEPDTAHIHVYDAQFEDVDTNFVVTPPAVGINPDSTLRIINHTNNEVEVNVKYTPEDAWWDDKTVETTCNYNVSSSGSYRFQITINNETHNSLVTAYNTINTKRRYKYVEEWLEDEPTFDVDVAKYTKQAVSRKWVNTDVIDEPIIGLETVHKDSPLVLTEGVTDTITAHQYNIPCIAPATNNFKKEHFDKICEIAEKVSSIFIVNDNERTNAGINGALRTGTVIENRGYQVRIAELPLPDGQDKIDLAEYLKNHTRDEFISLLEDSVKPDEHEMYDPERHDPNYTQNTINGTELNTDSKNNTQASKSQYTPDENDENHSALYDISLQDIIEANGIKSSSGSGDTHYRGKNPIQHHGSSENYFAIYDHGTFYVAIDYKIESQGSGYMYNPRTWLACEASCDCNNDVNCNCTRSTRNPSGSLSNSEIWWAWKHAKEQGYIPKDDPVPIRAMWFLAEYHDLLPKELIPKSFEDNLSFPQSKYKEVSKIIEERYELPPGREF